MTRTLGDADGFVGQYLANIIVRKPLPASPLRVAASWLCSTHIESLPRGQAAAQRTAGMLVARPTATSSEHTALVCSELQLDARHPCACEAKLVTTRDARNAR